MILLAVSVLPDNALAQDCLWDDINWSAYSSINVYVHPDLAENLTRQDGSPWTDIELEKEVRCIIETLQENLASGAPRFIYQGQSSGWDWDETIPHAVHIVPEDCGAGNQCNCFATGAVTGANDYSFPYEGARIKLKRSGAGTLGGNNLNLYDCNFMWEHWWSDDVSGLDTLRAVMHVGHQA